MPPAARPPVFTVIRPILIGTCCAIAGIGKLAAPAIAAVPAMKLRRLIFLVISILPVGGALLPARELVADSIGSDRADHQRRKRPHRGVVKPSCPRLPTLARQFRVFSSFARGFRTPGAAMDA